MRLLFFLLIFPIIVFSQSMMVDSINYKKRGFYSTAEALYNNNPLNYKNDSILINEADLISNKDKVFTKKFIGSELPYFAYSDGKFVYFNSKNYKENGFFSNTDYFVKSYRWADYYFFEERFVTLIPGGFVGFGGVLGGFSGVDLALNGNIVVQNMFCSFDVKKENFFCIEKQEIRRRIKKNYPEIFKKYRKSKKSLNDYIETLKEISLIDTRGVDNIIH